MKLDIHKYFFVDFSICEAHNLSIFGTFLACKMRNFDILGSTLSDQLSPDINIFRTNLFRPKKVSDHLNTGPFKFRRNGQSNGSGVVRGSKFHCIPHNTRIINKPIPTPQKNRK